MLNLDYTGTKGTRLDILEAPNRTATGVLFAGRAAVLLGRLRGQIRTANALSVRVRKRLQAGFRLAAATLFEVDRQCVLDRKR